MENKDNSLCNHIWSDIKYDPEFVNIMPSPIIGVGAFSKSHFIKVDRWSKECSKCGKKLYIFKKLDYEKDKGSKTRKR